MSAAIAAARKGASVVLLEKKEDLGKKLLLTGKGRCNVTNMCDLEEFIARFSSGGKFLRDAFNHFFNEDVVRFFEQQGVPLKVERQNRVFPKSDKAASILNALKKALKQHQVEVICDATVKRILVDNGKVCGLIVNDGKKYAAKCVILATGGSSYPQTGSTGDGYRLSAGLGHTVVPPEPALVPMETEESFPRQVMGLTLKNVCLTFQCGKKKKVSEVGELLFTDFGVSGPLVISASGEIVKMLGKGKVVLSIDLKPALSEPQIEKRLLREIHENPRMQIKNLMKHFLPVNFSPVFLARMKIDGVKSVSHLSAEERRSIVSGLKAFCLQIARPRPLQYAMVTQGGVSLKEVNPKTMESRIIPGLFFAGEILDVDGDTGGFNLQAAFSTGFLAGSSAVD